MTFTVVGMASKRRNPKKNKAARRPRPDMPGLRRARLQLDDVHRIMAPAAAAHCVDGCLTLHYALGEFGLESRVEAIGLRIEGNGSRTLYGHQEGPRVQR